jgi:integrase
VKPFREADAAVVRYLTGTEIKRIVNASAPGFRDLVSGAPLTGCRYGEFIRMISSDFNSEAETVTVRISKAGKPRHVTLTGEGTQLFRSLTAGRKPRELIFRRPDDMPWKASHQQRPLIEASKRAKIEPAVTFHVLRHTYASILAMKGAPMGGDRRSVGPRRHPHDGKALRAPRSKLRRGDYTRVAPENGATARQQCNPAEQGKSLTGWPEQRLQPLK